MFVALLLAIATYSKPTTTLCSYGGKVFVGNADGGVERLSASLVLEQSFRGSKDQPVSFVSASPYGLAWLSGPGGSIREKLAPPKPAQQTLYIVPADSNKVFTAVIQPDKPVRRLAWLAGRVAVSYDFGASFFDSRAQSVSPDSFFPKSEPGLSKSSMWVREMEDGTELALFGRPYSVRRNPQNQNDPLVSLLSAYQVGSWQWVKLGGFATTAFDAFPEGELLADEEGKISGDAKFLVLSDRVALAEDGIVAREPASLLNAPVAKENWEVARTAAAAIPGDLLWFGAAGDNAWWWNGTALVQQNRRTGEYAAFLPWNSEAKITAFAPIGSGIYVGSSDGVRFLDASQPEQKLGYAGFVRVSFGPSIPEGDAKKLTDAVFAWRFADAEKAGPDGAVMIASIFSTVGVQLPQTAAELRAAGEPVIGDLQFGDVLVTPTQTAFYLGGGLTVQMRGGRVSNGDVWSWPKASVRRFWKPALSR